MKMWYTYELSEMLLSYREYCAHLYMISAESPSSMKLDMAWGARLVMCTCFSICFGNSKPYRYGFLFLKTCRYVFINLLFTEYFENIPAWFQKKETIPVCFQLRPPANFTSTLNVICDVVSWRRSMKFTHAIDRHVLQRRTKFDVNTSRDVEVIDV